ncbi:MAG: hypothetical protein WC958_00575 [Dehalococcoidales bacterium]
MLYFGFLFIFAGWIVQIYQVISRKDKSVNLLLPIFYGAGSLLLFADSFIGGNAIAGLLNALCVILVMILFAVVFTTKK